MGKSALKKIKPGVRQGRVLSPDLFNVCSEIIIPNLEGYPEIKVGGPKLNYLRYTDGVL